MSTDLKILQLEFKGDNHIRLGNIWWMLVLINQIENRYDSEFILGWLSKNGHTKTALEEAINIRNYDRKIIRQYGYENEINPNWLLEYKDIDPADYLHLVKPNL